MASMCRTSRRGLAHWLEADIHTCLKRSLRDGGFPRPSLKDVRTEDVKRYSLVRGGRLNTYCSRSRGLLFFDTLHLDAINAVTRLGFANDVLLDQGFSRCFGSATGMPWLDVTADVALL